MAFSFPPTYLRPVPDPDPHGDVQANARWLIDEHFGPLIGMLSNAVVDNDLQAARILAGDLVESAAGLENLLRNG